MTEDQIEIKDTHWTKYRMDKKQPRALRLFLMLEGADYLGRKRMKELLGIKEEPRLFASMKETVTHQGKTWQKGQRVRVVMVSRFGDVGITQRLQDASGYGIRLSLDYLTDFSDRRERD